MGLALRAIGQKQASTEQQLVAAVRQGDDRAFEELFSRYRSRITGYVLGMVRDHARAEDITQEVFLSALRRLRDSERPIAFKPWIYEIAKNACIDEFRRTRRASEVSLNADDDSPSGDGSLVSKQLTPDAAIENKQRLEALRGAFRGLSETHHRLLVMRELEGLSYREIADRMEMSRPMVESTLFRARRRLGEEYQELTSGRRCQQVCEVVDRADATTVRVLGVRARRQVAIHLSYCDDCRRYARVAGADEALFKAPTFADKVAALLPFGWLGRRFGASGGAVAKRSAHGFVARHMPNASQYLGPVGSSVILGRVAAAVLVIAAAGGGYAGVSSVASPNAVHNAAATIRGPGGSGGGSSSSGGGTTSGTLRTPQSLAASAAALRQSSQAVGLDSKLSIGAGAAGLGKLGSKPGTKHGSGSGASPGGPGSSAAGSSTAPGTSGGHHGVLRNSPAGNVLGRVLAPITSHVPSIQKPLGPLPVRVPGAQNVNPIGAPVTPKLPSPQSAVSQAGQTAGNVAAGAGKALSGLMPPGH